MAERRNLFPGGALTVGQEKGGARGLGCPLEEDSFSEGMTGYLCPNRAKVSLQEAFMITAHLQPLPAGHTRKGTPWLQLAYPVAGAGGAQLDIEGFLSQFPGSKYPRPLH